jgi:phosphate:Na+ symporter
MHKIPFDFWMFLAGLGVFLFGMRHLEDGIKGLAGKSFQNFIKRFTSKSWKGILTGTFVTAVLQSSSMVTLLVLAFLGAGVLGLKSALGIVLGANLGTTITAWIVAALGFKMNIADFSYPFLAVGILSYLFLKSKPVLKNIGVFLIGFGLIFLGLDFMKVTLDRVADQIDITLFSHYGLWSFLLLGLIITALIQSSSAMIVIILSTLNAELIDVYQSFAMIIGANMGTTTTLLLGSIGGNADKKRLAFANVVFNITGGTFMFLFLRQSVDLVYNLSGIKDPLMELVLLNTLLNLSIIFLFWPLLGQFQKFLGRRFMNSEPKGETLFIKNIDPVITEVALKAVEQELKEVKYQTISFLKESFGIGQELSIAKGWKHIFRSSVSLNSRYEKLKTIEDEIFLFHNEIQKQSLSTQDAENLTTCMMSLRSLVYSAKHIKDVVHNIMEMTESENQLARDLLFKLQTFINEQIEIIKLADSRSNKELISLQQRMDNTNVFYEQTIAFLYDNIKNQPKKTISVSSLTNVIKQTVSSMNSLHNAF